MALLCIKILWIVQCSAIMHRNSLGNNQSTFERDRGMASKIYTAEEAIKTFIKDDDFLVFAGFGDCTVAYETICTLREMFLETGFPKNLSVMCGGGNRGLDLFGEEGLVKMALVGHYGPSQHMIDLVSNNKIASYNIPQGLIGHLLRAVTNREVGLVTRIGLNTVMDPRVKGAKMSECTTEDLVELIDVAGEEYLLYKSPHVDVTLLRGTYADEQGNISFEGEIVESYAKYAAMAAKACGGKVIVEVRDIVADTLPGGKVAIPGIFVDAIVKQVNPEENYRHSENFVYRPEMLGLVRIPTPSYPPLELNARSLIARRSALELVPNAFVNLGIGIPELISNVAQEEGCIDDITLSIECGFIGGFNVPGERMTIHPNYDCVNDEPMQFDVYHSGCLDVAFLGFAEVNFNGDVNVSRFGGRVCGVGGFIDIAQCAKAVVFTGTFTAKGLRETVGEGKLTIIQEGKNIKFKDEIEEISFSGKQALKEGTHVIYVTERAVFELREEGMTLIEVAPGIDLQKDILDQMTFEPIIASDLKLMDEKLFTVGSIGLREVLDAKKVQERNEGN